VLNVENYLAPHKPKRKFVSHVFLKITILLREFPNLFFYLGVDIVENITEHLGYCVKENPKNYLEFALKKLMD